MDNIFTKYNKLYTCTFAVGAALAYFTADPVLAMMLLSLSSKSKMVIAVGIYAAAASPICQIVSTY